MLKPDLQHAAYMRLNAACDVMLDSLHWSGGNTSIDAIAAALPVVTRPGRLMRGRQSAAMLRAMGLDELVAVDLDDHVAKAVALGRDPQRREAIAERIRAGRGALFGRDEPIRALEDFLGRAAD
jgi:CRISPR-associated protein Csy1